MAIVAGVDFGTLSVRVSIIDSERGRLATAIAEYPLHRKRDDPDYATQSHANQMQAQAQACRQAISNASLEGKTIEAIALDTTGSSVIPVDAKAGRSVRRDNFPYTLTFWASQFWCRMVSRPVLGRALSRCLRLAHTPVLKMHRMPSAYRTRLLCRCQTLSPSTNRYVRCIATLTLPWASAIYPLFHSGTFCLN